MPSTTMNVVDQGVAILERRRDAARQARQGPVHTEFRAQLRLWHARQPGGHSLSAGNSSRRQRAPSASTQSSSTRRMTTLREPTTTSELSSVTTHAPTSAPALDYNDVEDLVLPFNIVRVHNGDIAITSHRDDVDAINKAGKVIVTGQTVSRKPVEGNCYVCLESFWSNKQVDWCAATCGQNIHVKCRRTWMESEMVEEGRVGGKCPFCRGIFVSGNSIEKQWKKVRGCL